MTPPVAMLRTLTLKGYISMRRVSAMDWIAALEEL